MYRPPLVLAMALRSSRTPDTSLPKAIVVDVYIYINKYMAMDMVRIGSSMHPQSSSFYAL